MESAAILTNELDRVANEAVELEQQGADIVTAAELTHDPIMQLTLAASATDKVKLMTWISIAFARSPMTLALQAHELNALSKGRFVLGIGSQIKPHIERRYSMTWSKPAARMREYVQAMKAIWSCWYEGTPLKFEGEFFQHTLMTPMFSPQNTQYGAPPVFVAAVGPLMTENAAEVADGILLHSFSTEEYMRSVTLPAVAAGLKKSGRTQEQFRIAAAPFIVTGSTEEEYQAVLQATCHQIAFYASTPAYRGVLESIGYEGIQPELTRLSKAGDWAQMGKLIDARLIDKIALVGDLQEIEQKLSRRYADIFDICSASVLSGAGYSSGGYSVELGNILKRQTAGF